MAKKQEMILTPGEFEFTKQVEAITLDQLNQSLRVVEVSGQLPRTRPVESYDFINTIYDMCTKNKVIFDPEPIYVDKSGARRIVPRGHENDKSIDRYLFEKIITRVQLHDANPTWNPSIAISYNDKGLAVSFGTNVRICQNMSILSPTNYICTWGSKKEQYDRMLLLVEGWLNKMDSLKEEDYATLTAMQNTRVSGKDAMQLLYGKLLDSAVDGTYFGNNDNAPLNIGQASKFVQEVKKQGIILTMEPTVYDIYNVGTSLLNLYSNEFSTAMENQVKWTEFLKQEYMMN